MSEQRQDAGTDVFLFKQLCKNMIDGSGLIKNKLSENDFKYDFCISLTLVSARTFLAKITK